MKILINQTCDAHKYFPILRATQRVNSLYARLHGYEYSAFVGLKKGNSPVHAAFNRAFLMSELKRAGFNGWYCYLDADAYFGNLQFDLTAYLNENSEHGFIASRASSDPRKWAINNGVFFLNMGHPIGQSIVDKYQYLIDQLVPADYWDLSNADWPPGAYDDQNILYGVLGHNPEILENMKNEEGSFNCGTSGFIHQILRAMYPNFDERVGKVEQLCDAVINDFIKEINPLLIKNW